MNIIELIDSIDPLLNGTIDVVTVRLRLAQVRVAAEGFESELAKARAAQDKSSAEYRKIIRQKSNLISQIAKLADNEMALQDDAKN